MDAAIDAMAQLGFPPEKVKGVVKQLLQEYGGDEGLPFIEDCAYLELINAILRDVAEKTEDKVAEDDDDRSRTEEQNAFALVLALKSILIVLFELPLISTIMDKDMSLDGGGAGETCQEILPPSEAAVKVEPSGVVTAEPEPTFSEVLSSSSGIHNEVGESVVIPSSEGEAGKGWIDILQDQAPEHVVVNAAKTVSKNNDAPPMAKTQSPPRNNEIQVSPLLANIASPPPTNARPAPRRKPCYFKDFIYLTPARKNVEAKSVFMEVPKHKSGGGQCRPKRKSRWDQGPADRRF